MKIMLLKISKIYDLKDHKYKDNIFGILNVLMKDL